MWKPKPLAQPGGPQILPRLQRVKDHALIHGQRGPRPLGELLQKLCLVGNTQPHDDIARPDQFAGRHQSGALNRYPTPVSVTMYSGFSVSGSIFWRSALI